MYYKFLVFFLLFAINVTWFVPTARAEGTISGSATRDAIINVALPITDVQISGRTGVIPVKLLVTSGTLAMSTVTGLTFTGDQTGSEIYFSGDVDDVNNALATLTYTRARGGYFLRITTPCTNTFLFPPALPGPTPKPQSLV